MEELNLDETKFKVRKINKTTFNGNVTTNTTIWVIDDLKQKLEQNEEPESKDETKSREEPEIKSESSSSSDLRKVIPVENIKSLEEYSNINMYEIDLNFVTHTNVERRIRFEIKPKYIDIMLMIIDSFLNNKHHIHCDVRDSEGRLYVFNWEYDLGEGHMTTFKYYHIITPYNVCYHINKDDLIQPFIDAKWKLLLYKQHYDNKKKSCIIS